MLDGIPDAEEIIEAGDLLEEHGEPFNYDGWRELQKLGYWPIKIEAVPEGTVVPTHNVLVQITNTDPRFYWLPPYLETMLLRGTWYPTTVCTISWMCKKAIMASMQRTADNPEEGLLFKLHDFGARGASSLETAMYGGCAHLVNFKGTDTLAGIVAARKFYNEPMAGYSIPAAEHSTITSWGGPGEAGEIAAYKNMLDRFLKPGKMVAVVSDSYDIYNAITNIWGGPLKRQIEESEGTLVIRPDSGKPVKMVCEVTKLLMNTFGYHINRKGFDVLPPYLRVLQGDGVEYDSIKDILTETENRQFSTDNFAFGMGGALLQNLNRDFLNFTEKTSYGFIGGGPRDIYKDPITDTGKRSKRGRLALVQIKDELHTVPEADAWRFVSGNLLRTVYEDSQLIVEDDFEKIRKTAAWYLTNR